MAVPYKDSIDFGSLYGSINNKTPVNPGDAATKSYVDSAIAGVATVPSPTNTGVVSAGATAAMLHSGTGFVFGVLVTTPASNPLTITDGSSGGTTIAYVQANQPAGWIPFPQPVPYAYGIYVNSGANTPAITVSYV